MTWIGTALPWLRFYFLTPLAFATRPQIFIENMRDDLVWMIGVSFMQSTGKVVENTHFKFGAVGTHQAASACRKATKDVGPGSLPGSNPEPVLFDIFRFVAPIPI